MNIKLDHCPNCKKRTAHNVANGGLYCQVCKEENTNRLIRTCSVCKSFTRFKAINENQCICTKCNKKIHFYRSQSQW